MPEYYVMKWEGSGGKAPRVFKLDTRWKWMANFTLWPL